MDLLPKDLLIMIALNMDLVSIINLCRTKKIFNEKICKNNNFWLNKLIKDYNVRTHLSNAKKEYLRINFLIENDDTKVLGIDTGDLNLVKASVKNGALLSYESLIISLNGDNDDIIEFLMKSIFNDKNKIDIIFKILDFFEKLMDKKVRSKIFLKLYSILFPYIHPKYFNNETTKILKFIKD